MALFLDSSSVHGLKHFAARRRHPLEIGVWAVSVGVALYGTIWLSLSTWRRYQDNPTVISMERNYKEWNTTFPAITICPGKKIDPQSLNATIESGGLLIEDVPWISMLAESKFRDLPPRPAALAPQYFLYTLLNVAFNFTYTLSNSNSEMLQLTPTLTEMGLCYAYNSQVAFYNRPSYWQSKNWSIVTVPPLFQGNPLDGDSFAQVMDMSSQYTVYIHSPGETVDLASTGNSSPEMYYKAIEITALSIYSTEGARKLSVGQRKCRFLHESDLLLSPAYSYTLCRMQCRMLLANKLCGCVPHYYRPSEGYKICDVKGLHCIAAHEDRLVKLRVKAVREPCKCLPLCDDISFSIHSESTVEWFLGTNFKYGLVQYPKTRLKRDVLFGFTDLLVQFGGTAGLCLGCSVLSIVELIYFLTLRLFWFISKNNL